MNTWLESGVTVYTGLCRTTLHLVDIRDWFIVLGS